MRELSAKLTEGENSAPNDQPCLGAIKVCDIVSNRFLPLKTHRIVSQKIIPQFSFPRGHIFSQHLGQRDILFVAGFFVLYAFIGKNLSLRRVVYELFYGENGVLTTPVNVCSKYIVVFIIFGAFLAPHCV